MSVDVVLDRTPFYAESGGQVADIGYLCSHGDASTSSSGVLLEVSDVQKGAGGKLLVHNATLKRGSLRVGEQVRAGIIGDEETKGWDLRVIYVCYESWSTLSYQPCRTS